MRGPTFLAVSELVEAMDQLDQEKFAKRMAYLANPHEIEVVFRE